MIQTLNGTWNYRIGKGKWTQRQVPFSSLCVGHSECQRYFDLEEKSKVVLLKLDGITYNANIYLNDTFLCKTLPYCEYVVDITDVVKRTNNSILVEIEDINAEFGPSEGWENYGGIIRDVSIIYKESSYINDVCFTQRLINDYKDAYYTVDISSNIPCEYCVYLYRNDCLVDSYTSSKTQERLLRNIELWSPKEPNLYRLFVELIENGKTVDTYETMVGFKELKCNKNHFCLNGEELFLKGVCRHEMYGRNSGHTVPYENIFSDMKMIKDAGCNFVRLVHYPHNKATLEIADRLGLLVCEEPGMWQADVNNKSLTQECIEVLKRTIIRDRNHVSIAFWLAFNECDFNVEFIKEAVSICRRYDPYRLVSGANNMPNEETKECYNLCNLDFYTMHPYSETFEMAKRASKILCDKPLMFTEWGGYYVYDNPHLLTDFLMSMYELYKNNRLAGTCLWYWAEINDYNRGGAACVDGVLKEALLDFDRKPNMIYDAFCKAIKHMDDNDCLVNKYEATLLIDVQKEPFTCTSEPQYERLLELAQAPLITRLAKTRKKQVKIGPILQRNEVYGISKIPYVVTDTALEFKGKALTENITIIGMTSLNYGYPLFGEYGEDAMEIIIQYDDGESQKYIAKNGCDITIAHRSIGSSRINPIAENALRALEFSYDKNFEEYLVNKLDIKTEKKPISSVTIKSINDKYNVLIYGVLA